MNARKSIHSNVTRTILSGAMLAMLSFNAVAESTATLDARAPLPATLLPSIKVSASISNPSAAVRWSIAPGRPTPVTLMPTLTVSANAYALTITTLPTVTVIASDEILPSASAQALVLAPSSDPPILHLTN